MIVGDFEHRLALSNLNRLGHPKQSVSGREWKEVQQQCTIW